MPASRQPNLPTTASRTATGLPLRDYTERVLTDYFAHLDGHAPKHLHEWVMREVEEPLLRIVLQRSSGNLSRAAAMLGITRTTLRKKLREYGLLAS